ncbi:hypothetical protein MBEHAL_2149 [Halarchaeum acidiphilum MH1-52-1]|uniref:Uncharacterized protein n=1 Tax=Halarchaeum acidiphilum MH1-52-1 TaxID=1261545 RepID=U3A6W5_9EURY|nr:hypothetical protein [Halarchaeum acidiphilum]GAD53389.1 hypothetical protein MBEHAL_2149 [Halarchaeum acidiphilum MH1-52-1]
MRKRTPQTHIVGSRRWRRLAAPLGRLDDVSPADVVTWAGAGSAAAERAHS